MRHGDKVNNLSRKSAHRKAMLSNMAASLILHKRIKTTVAKAKALRVYAEPLITKGKEDTTHNRRVVFSYLADKEAVKELFDTVANKVGDRPGGYTRILRMGFRHGDNAEMAMIELVDFNDLYTQSSEEKKGRKRKRTRRAGGAAAPVAAPRTETPADVTEEVVEDIATETPEAVEAPEVVAEETATPEAATEEVVDTPEAVEAPEEVVAEEAATPEAAVEETEEAPEAVVEVVDETPEAAVEEPEVKTDEVAATEEEPEQPEASSEEGTGDEQAEEGEGTDEKEKQS